MKNWKTAKVKKLAETLAHIHDKDEMLAFLRDLCTLDELNEISTRWEIVHMLEEKIPYREIAEKTGASTATVTRISHWLKNGAGGYRTILKKKKSKDA